MNHHVGILFIPSAFADGMDYVFIFYKLNYLYEDITRIVSEDPTLNPFSLKIKGQVTPRYKD